MHFEVISGSLVLGFRMLFYRFYGEGAGSVPAPVRSLLEPFGGHLLSVFFGLMNLFNTRLTLQAPATKTKSR